MSEEITNQADSVMASGRERHEIESAHGPSISPISSRLLAASPFEKSCSLFFRYKRKRKKEDKKITIAECQKSNEEG